MEYIQKVSRKNFDEVYHDFFKGADVPLEGMVACGAKEIVKDEKKAEFYIMWSILNGIVIEKGLEKHSATIMNDISKLFTEKIPEKTVYKQEEIIPDLILGYSKSVRSYYDRYLEFGKRYIKDYKPRKTKT